MMFARLQIRMLIVLAAALSCISGRTCAQNTDLPVAPPHQVALNPCFSTRNTSIPLVDGSRVQAVELVCGGSLTWDVPQGASSFHVTLWRSEVADAFAGSRPGPTGVDPIRVLISLDGKAAADAVLRYSTPAEQWVVPLPSHQVHTVTVEMEEEYGEFGVYLGDPGFSSQQVPVASVRHLLTAGQAFVNLGSGARQVAFSDFYPGENVPIQVEFAGKAAGADVQIRISPLTGAGGRTIPLHVALHAQGNEFIGASQWQVPDFYGPAHVQLDLSADGKQVYSNSFQIALAKTPDLSTTSKKSFFGINQSGSGSLLLQDDEASLWGTKWSRIFLDWDVIEANQGHYDWHWIDNVFQSYSNQHFEVVGVLGHLPPKWITDPSTQMMPAYAKFVNAALEHFKGRVNVWDVYNEIDVKFYSGKGFNRKQQPEGDIQILKQELGEIHQLEPGAYTLCCAPGGLDFVGYEKRLFDAGILSMIGATEFHSYQAGPPEESDFGYTFVESVNALLKLEASYGQRKPVWVTESNWQFGPAGTPDVRAPQVTEHEQSQYLVRCALLSLALHAPYIIHSPFFFPWHRDVLVDSLASYSQLTSRLAGALDARSLSLPAHVYGVAATTEAGAVVALWTDSVQPVPAHVSGMSGLKVEDMYGNPLPATQNLTLSGSPIYLVGRGTPTVTAQAPNPPRAITLPPVASWRIPASTRGAQAAAGGLHLTSLAAKYDRQATSPVLNLSPNSCYVVMPVLTLHKGGVNVQIIDPDAGKDLRDEFVYAVNGNDQYQPKIRVKTSQDGHLQVAFTDANPNDPAVSDFEVGNVQVSACP